MDELILKLSELSALLLPILGVVVLVFLILLLRQTLNILKQVSGTVTKVDSTIQTVENSLIELKGPLHTLNRISGSVDLVQDATENAIKTLIVAVSSNFDLIKDWITAFLDKKKTKNQEFQEPLE
jgi:predicted PurR-regulated permease PerM